MIIRIAPLAAAAPADVEALLDAAFGTDRRTRTAYRIRTGVTADPDLSFTAFEGERLVGSLQTWPVGVGEVPVLLVGPVAVDPARQRAGIGRRMMERLVSTAPDLPMAMIGDPEYYGRFFGFSAEDTGGWAVPGPVERHRLLARHAGGLPRHGNLGPRTFAVTGPNA
jgi:predicted N-acetyltransferase YhbS